MKSFVVDINGESLESVDYEVSAKGLPYIVAFGRTLRADRFLRITGPIADRIEREEAGEYGFWKMNYDPILTREVAEGRYNYDRYNSDREYDGLESLEL